MIFSHIESKDILYFKEQIGSSYVLSQDLDCDKYSHDHTEDLKYPPQLVLLPANSSEISIIMKYCFENNICVTPRGAGTGLSGGALPIQQALMNH